jgi:predicted transcriptional regulator
MPEGTDNLQKLHATLVQDGYDLPDFNTFKTDMSDPATLEKLRVNLLNDKYDLPDSATFSNDMGLKKKESTPAVTSGSEVSSFPTQITTEQDYKKSLLNPNKTPEILDQERGWATQKVSHRIMLSPQENVSLPPSIESGQPLGIKDLSNSLDKRINDPYSLPSDYYIKNDNNSVSSIEMSSSDNLAFPMINEVNGKLHRFTDWREALDYAKKTNTVKEFNTDKEAEDYANNGYKKGTPLENFDQTKLKHIDQQKIDLINKIKPVIDPQQQHDIDTQNEIEKQKYETQLQQGVGVTLSQQEADQIKPLIPENIKELPSFNSISINKALDDYLFNNPTEEKKTFGNAVMTGVSSANASLYKMFDDGVKTIAHSVGYDISDDLKDKSYTDIIQDGADNPLAAGGLVIAKMLSNLTTNEQNRSAKYEKNSTQDVFSNIVKGGLGMSIDLALIAGTGGAGALTKFGYSIPVSKFGLLIGGKDLMSEMANPNATTGKRVLAGAKGYVTGNLFDYASIIGGKALKSAGEGLSKTGISTLKQNLIKAPIQPLTVGSIFGGLGAAEDLLNEGKIDRKKFETNFGMGIAFEVGHVYKGLKKAVDTKAGLLLYGSEPKVTALLEKTNFDIDKMIDVRNEISDNYFKTMNEAEKLKLKSSYDIVNNVLMLKGIAEDFKENPATFFENIAKSDLPDQTKKALTDHLQELYTELKPEIKEQEAKNTEIKSIEQQKENVQNMDLSETVKKDLTDDLDKKIDEINKSEVPIIPTEEAPPVTESTPIQPEKKLEGDTEPPSNTRVQSEGGVGVKEPIKIKSFKTDEGNFSVYDIDKEHVGRADMFTVLEDKNGWIVRNALIPDEIQNKGIATKFYQKMNAESIKETGNPLRSTQERTLITGEKVHEISQEGIKLWESLVKKGFAEKLGDKNYQFIKLKPNEKESTQGQQSEDQPEERTAEQAQVEKESKEKVDEKEETKQAPEEKLTGEEVAKVGENKEEKVSDLVQKVKTFVSEKLQTFTITKDGKYPKNEIIKSKTKILENNGFKRIAYRTSIMGHRDFAKDNPDYEQLFMHPDGRLFLLTNNERKLIEWSKRHDLGNAEIIDIKNISQTNKNQSNETQEMRRQGETPKEVTKPIEIKPNKEVSASKQTAIAEVSKKEGIKPMELSILDKHVKEQGETFVVDELDVNTLTGKMLETLENKEYIEIIDEKNNGEITFKLTDKGKSVIDFLDARLETRRNVKAGTELFPEVANIPELKNLEKELKKYKPESGKAKEIQEKIDEVKSTPTLPEKIAEAKTLDELAPLLNKANEQGLSIEWQKRKEQIVKDNKTFADRIREGKIGDDVTLVGIPFGKEIWNGALEVVARVIETTGDIVKALEAGLQHIREEAKKNKLTEEDQKHLEDRFSNYIDTNKDFKKTEPVSTDEVKQILEDNKKLNEVKKSLITKLKDSKAGSILKEIIKTFHPFWDTTSRKSAIILRRNIGEMERQNVIADQGAEKRKMFFDKLTPEERIAFITNLERGKKFDNPELQKFSDEYRKRLDHVYDLISFVKDVPYIEDYMPHFWKNTKKALSFFSKKPLEGNKSFLKERFYQDILAGLKNGLELVSDNPEEITRLAEINAFKFDMANKLFDDLSENGLIKFYRDRSEAPDGWVIIDDPLFKRRATFIVEGEEGQEAVSKQSGYYAPAEAAEIIRRYTSRGLQGDVVNTIRMFNNTLNQLQLGLSAFHFATTTIDNAVTSQAIAIDKLSRGKIQEGVQGMLESITVLPATWKSLKLGGKIINDYKSGVMNTSVERMISANARVGYDAIYKTKMLDRFQRSMAQSKYWTATLQAPMAILDMVSKPLFEYYVPRLKVGSFEKLAQNELSKLDNPTQLDIDKVLQKQWDNIENRLGQMTYDNLFWNKVTKDIGFLMTRSLGWNLGTIRAFGEGVGNIPKSAKSVYAGKGIDPSTAWLLALIAQTAMLGAVATKLSTGKNPEDWKDYFYPQDGTINSDGTAGRLQFPTYMKEVFNTRSHIKNYGLVGGVGLTISNKLAPGLAAISEMIQNKDFYNNQVVNPDDPFYIKGEDYLKFLGDKVKPFSLTGRPGDEGLFHKKVQRFFGLVGAPREIERTDWQNIIVHESSMNASDKPRTKYEQKRSDWKFKYKEAIFKKNGDVAKELAKEGFTKGYVTSESLVKLRRESITNPYYLKYKNLSVEQQVKILNNIDQEDAIQLIPYTHNISQLKRYLKQKPEKEEEINNAIIILKK